MRMNFSAWKDILESPLSAEETVILRIIISMGDM